MSGPIVMWLWVLFGLLVGVMAFYAVYEERHACCFCGKPWGTRKLYALWQDGPMNRISKNNPIVFHDKCYDRALVNAGLPNDINYDHAVLVNRISMVLRNNRIAKKRAFEEAKLWRERALSNAPDEEALFMQGRQSNQAPF